MPYIDLTTLHSLVGVVSPLVRTDKDRRSFVESALAEKTELLGKIQWYGTAELFLLKLFQLLMEEALAHDSADPISAFLRVARGRLGRVHHRLIDQVIRSVEDSLHIETKISESTPLLHLKIFLASPGDVADERQLARKVIENLPYDPLLREKILLEEVSWDRTGSETPMLASTSPQVSVIRNLPAPSECDVVVVILWSRIGTPLNQIYHRKNNGGLYNSGTEWEYLDALAASRERGTPDILVYRKKEKPRIELDDPRLDEALSQWESVKGFFSTFDDSDGSALGGYNSYETPDGFRKLFESHLKAVVRRQLDATKQRSSVSINTGASPLEYWMGSPFPGLRAFTPEDASIFFGRGRETDELLERLADKANRFIAVVGASGSGKSSLVAAGLIPRLLGGAMDGCTDWRWIRFTPGTQPFVALANALHVEPGEEPGLDESLHWIESALNDVSDDAELLVFIDQFEEFLTLTLPRFRGDFVEWLTRVTTILRIRVIVTLRADFYAGCVEWEPLAHLLRTGSFPLSAPNMVTLHEMITRPADRAALHFESGLPVTILEDTGTDPGSLALMAFALAELYAGRTDAGELTFESYNAFEGVQGVIGKRAEETLAALDSPVQDALSGVFRELVEVDERGVVTRQRAPKPKVALSPESDTLVSALTDARLLVSNMDSSGVPIIEVAHEALLRSWPRLADWIDNCMEDLRQLRQVRIAVDEWVRHNRAEEFLWPEKRCHLQAGMLHRLRPPVSEDAWKFLGDELRELQEMYKAAHKWMSNDYKHSDLWPEERQQKIQQIVTTLSVDLNEPEQRFINRDFRFLREIRLSALEWRKRGFPVKGLWTEEKQADARRTAEACSHHLTKIETLFVDNERRLLTVLPLKAKNWAQRGYIEEELWPEDKQVRARKVAEKYKYELNDEENLFVSSDLRLLREVRLSALEWKSQGLPENGLWAEEKQADARHAAEVCSYHLTDTEMLFVDSERRLLRALPLEAKDWVQRGYIEEELWSEDKQVRARKVAEKYRYEINEEENHFVCSDLRLLREVRLSALEWESQGLPENGLWAEEKQADARHAAEICSYDLTKIEILFVDSERRLLRVLPLEAEEWVQSGYREDRLWSPDKQAYAQEIARRNRIKLSEQESLFIVPDFRLLRDFQLSALEWEKHGASENRLWPEKKRVEAQKVVELYAHQLSEIESSFLYGDIGILKRLPLEAENWVEKGYMEENLWAEDEQAHAKRVAERNRYKLNEKERLFIDPELRARHAEELARKRYWNRKNADWLKIIHRFKMRK